MTWTRGVFYQEDCSGFAGNEFAVVARRNWHRHNALADAFRINPYHYAFILD